MKEMILFDDEAETIGCVFHGDPNVEIFKCYKNATGECEVVADISLTTYNLKCILKELEKEKQ
jgi:hypothetical protein